MKNDEGARKGAPDDHPRSVAPASEAPGLTAEYRGGPLATVRVILDAYVRPDRAWESIQPSRPDNDPPPSPEATRDRGGDE